MYFKFEGRYRKADIILVQQYIYEQGYKLLKFRINAYIHAGNDLNIRTVGYANTSTFELEMYENVSRTWPG